MMREEFEQLTGLTVSHNYYTTHIEPEYAMGDTEKADFCAQWVKAHKTDICKALAPDIAGMTREDAVIRVKEAEYSRLRQITEEHRQEKEKAETEAHNLRFEMDRQRETIKKVTNENDQMGTEMHDLRQALAKQDAAINEQALAAKDAEIMKLKAMLFDLMYKTA